MIIPSQRNKNKTLLELLLPVFRLIISSTLKYLKLGGGGGVLCWCNQKEISSLPKLTKLIVLYFQFQIFTRSGRLQQTNIIICINLNLCRFDLVIFPKLLYTNEWMLGLQGICLFLQNDKFTDSVFILKPYYS